MNTPRTPSEVFRVRGLGLCTRQTINGRDYWQPHDQPHGTVHPRKVEPGDTFQRVTLAAAYTNHHHTQRAFFRAMVDVDRAFGVTPSQYSAWNPQHVSR